MPKVRLKGFWAVCGGGMSKRISTNAMKLLFGVSSFAMSDQIASAQTCSTFGHPDDNKVAEVKLPDQSSGFWPARTYNRELSAILNKFPPSQTYSVASEAGGRILRTSKQTTNSIHPRKIIEQLVETRQPDSVLFSVNSPWSGTHEFSRVALNYKDSNKELNDESIHQLHQVLNSAPDQEFILKFYEKNTLLDQTFAPIKLSKPQDVIKATQIGNSPDSLILTTHKPVGDVLGAEAPEIGAEQIFQIYKSARLERRQGDIDVVPVKIPNSGTLSEAIGQIPPNCVGLECSNDTTPNTGVSERTVNTVDSDKSTNERRMQIADATVMVTFYRIGPDGKYDFDRCNGINLGNGRIITNAHCFSAGAKNHVVWFGNIEWNDTHDEGPKRSELACHASRVKISYPQKLLRDNLPLDVAMLKVPQAYLQQIDSRFLRSPVEFSDSDPWCSSETKCLNPAKEQDFNKLSVVQIWASDPEIDKIQEGFPNGSYKRGIKTFSKNNQETFCGTRAYRGGQMSENKLRQVCSIEEHLKSKISPYGFVHDCDTVKGSSGAPIYLQSHLDAFINAKTSRLALAGLNRGGNHNRGNCVVPATPVKSLINP